MENIHDEPEPEDPQSSEDTNCTEPEESILQVKRTPAVASILNNLYSHNNRFNHLIVRFTENGLGKIRKILAEKVFPFEAILEVNIILSSETEIKEYVRKAGKLIYESVSEGILILQREKSIIIVRTFTTCSIKKQSYIEVFIYCEKEEDISIEVQEFKDKISELVCPREKYINLAWFYTVFNGRDSIRIRDKINDTFHKEAYPYIDLDRLCKEYYSGNEPILILFGPPGTGKTRLIRYILSSFCNIKGRDEVGVFFTSDQKIIESGDLFISFIGNSETNVLVLEDIDYHLTARKDGNTAMYNFLSVSNGLVIGHQEEKRIILSTNLPTVKNIDPALLRPGRCFGIINTRELYYDESVEFIKKLGIEQELEPKKSYSLAELYSLNKKRDYTLNKSIPKSSTGFI